MKDLETRLTELSERGTHLGAEGLRQRVVLDLAEGLEPARHPVSGWAIALAVAVIAVAIVGIPLLLLGGSDGSVEPSTPADTEPSSTATVVERTAVETVLAPVAGVDPVMMSTSIGDLEFITMEFPDDHAFDFPFHATVATPHGPVSVADSTLWWSSDYTTWNAAPIDSAITGRIVPDDEDIVVLSTTGASRFIWNENQWIAGEPIEVPSPVDSMAFGPRGVVAANATTIYYAVDGVRFTEAEIGPDLTTFVASDVNPEDEEFVEAARMDCRGTFGATQSEIRTVLATDSGFVALTSAIHPTDNVCAPLLWYSPDGNTWELVSAESPFGGADVDVLGIAERDGRFVAIGVVEPATRGFVWVSDDALTWEQVDLELTSPLMIDAGELGWVMTAAQAENDFTLWFSSDGYTWDGPHRIPDGLRIGFLVPEIVVGSDTVFGVGYREEVFVIGQLQ